MVRTTRANSAEKVGPVWHGVHHIVLVLLMACYWMSCSDTQTRDNNETGLSIGEIEGVFSGEYSDILVRELSADPQYLNPLLSNDYTSSLVENLMFNSMLEPDGTEESNFIGRLAEKWEISDDKLRITFFIRQGIKWHDGEPFSAEDVKFTFDTAMRKDIPAFGKKSTVEAIERIELEGTSRVVFHFKYQYSPALAYIGTTLIIPKHRLDEKGLAAETTRSGADSPVSFVNSEFSRNPIGTGAYKFVEWKTGQQIKLERNDNYWDRTYFPKIRHVLFKIIPNRTVAYNILQKGEIDVFRARPLQYMRFERLDDLKQNFKAEAFYEPNYFYIGWNNRPERKFFGDRQTRLAMSHAFDCQAFIDKVLYGLGQPISGPFYVKSWAYNHDIKPLAYDLDKAAQILAEQGWTDSDRDGILDRNGVKFVFELIVTTGSPSFAQLASILQANLKRLSIEVTINQFEWSVYLDRIRKGEFDAYLGGWSLGMEPDPYGIWHSSQIGMGNNYIGFKNAEVDKLLEQGRREFDRVLRQKIYARVHEIIHQEQPVTFVHSAKEVFILSKRIKDYSISPYGLFDFYPGQLAWRLE